MPPDTNTPDTKLSANFWLSEFTASRTAMVEAIANTPEPYHVGNLRRLAQVLEVLRSKLRDQPITILSGYRSPLLNARVGGSRTSAHMHGLAADLICPGYGTPLEVCHRIADSGLDFDQVIHEGTWMHFAIASRYLGSTGRRQVLTAQRGTGPVAYVEGLPS
jgi:zinc D-Ala-D-Ala carboxypeptidase